MQVLVNDFGERVRLYRPYINREESAMNVTIFVPETSHNTGLYYTEPINHLNGETSGGKFVETADAANFWYGQVPSTTVQPRRSYAASQPGVYSSPKNTFQARGYSVASHRNMAKVYGDQPISRRQAPLAGYGWPIQPDLSMYGY